MRLAASYDSESMKRALCLLCAMMLCGLLCSSLQAQAPASTSQQAPAPYIPPQNPTPPAGPVPISEEPRHRLVVQNDFVRVYSVMVPGLDATLLHRHDLPYLYVTLGAADIINAIVDKPEVHLVLQDGETHYSPGHFAHIVRTDSGMPFQNVTIELVRPQGTVRNFCKEVIPGQPTECPQQQSASGAMGKRAASDAAADPVPYFESEEVRVDLYKVASAKDYVDGAPKADALLVALTNANLDANLGGEHVSFLHGGDAVLDAPRPRRRGRAFSLRHSRLAVIFFH